MQQISKNIFHYCSVEISQKLFQKKSSLKGNFTRIEYSDIKQEPF